MTLSQSLDEAIQPLMADPEATAILLDIDGTLAPIVRDARDASVPVPTRSLLITMTRRYNVVAAVSGRQAEDARRVVAAGGLSYVGGHGSEILLPGESEATIDSSLSEWAETVQDAASEAVRDLSNLGVRREDKGAITAIHWRGAADEAACEAALGKVAVRVEDAGLVAHWGRKVLEIRPPSPFDKGLGIRNLLKGRPVRNAIYVGDDLTDIDAFNALAEMDASGELHHIVRVGVESEESPPELVAAADFMVAGIEGVEGLLARLASGDS